MCLFNSFHAKFDVWLGPKRTKVNCFRLWKGLENPFIYPAQKHVTLNISKRIDSHNSFLLIEEFFLRALRPFSVHYSKIPFLGFLLWAGYNVGCRKYLFGDGDISLESRVSFDSWPSLQLSPKIRDNSQCKEKYEFFHKEWKLLRSDYRCRCFIIEVSWRKSQ